MAPLISVIVPTFGRPTLEDTLNSIPKSRDIQTVVVADGPEAGKDAKEIIDRLGRRVTFDVTELTLKVGHPQREHGMTLAKGEWLVFMDDDDVYTPDAFKHLREAAGLPGPHIFRMLYAHGEILWASESLCRGNVGTPMFMCENNGRLGRWKPERTGDFDFINETCLKQGNKPVWHDKVICLVRPERN